MSTPDTKSSHLVLPEGVTHIDLWAYSQSTIISAYLPDSLRTIGMCAFKDCKSLKEVSMPPNARCNSHMSLGPYDGIFAGCSSLEQITFRGPLHSFIWYDSKNPELLRGFDREKTFYGCNQLRRMIAWEVPLSDIPEQWHSFALNGYLSDADRKTNYRPEIAAAYDRKLESRKEQLIRRTSTDESFALFQYLMERRWITNDNYDFVLQQARNKANVDATAALLEYRHKYLQTKDDFLEDMWAL